MRNKAFGDYLVEVAEVSENALVFCSQSSEVYTEIFHLHSSIWDWEETSSGSHSASMASCAVSLQTKKDANHSLANRTCFIMNKFEHVGGGRRVALYRQGPPSCRQTRQTHRTENITFATPLLGGINLRSNFFLIIDTCD